MTLGVTLNWLANWVVAFTFPLLHAAFGPLTFLIFAASTAAFGLFTRTCVPETRFKSQAELHAHFVQSCAAVEDCIGAL